ncbi:MAG: glycosyltransferase, partial [Desulfobacter sp.]
MKSNPKYILLINIHGLIRGHELELGRDADTGGQTKYVLEFATTLSKRPDVEQVDLMTRRIADRQVSEDYNKIIEPLNSKARIVRIDCGPKEYIPKENLWDYLDNFVDNALIFLKEQNNLPGIIHAHYADAGYVGIRLSHQLELPLVFTAHSLGRSKRKRLIAGGMKSADIEKRYNMARRINAEEETLGSAALVITSTSHEINEQYASYDFYQPDS